jgi:predicted Zn-dependent peptidase
MPGFQTKYAFFAANFGGCDRRFLLDGKWKEIPAGTAHFLEHKLFDMPEGSAAERLAALGASSNAYTGHGMTGYLFSCTENFAPCLEELLRFVTTPYFTPESVEKERGIIAQEISMYEDDPSRRVDRRFFRALYRGHPVRDPVTGTAESIGRITAEELYECHRRFYTPGNMVLCCAGDIDPEKVMALAEKLTVPGEEAPAREWGGDEDLSPASVRIEEKMAVSMPIFQLGAKLPWRPDPGEWTREMLLADLSCELLLGVGSPLYSEMYDAGIIDHSFYMGAYDFPRGGVVYAGGRCPDPMAVLGRISDAAEAFRMDAGAVARLERLKRARLGGFLMSLDAPEELPDVQAESYFGGWERMDFPALLESVRGADAERFLRETFRPERLALSVIAPI